MPRPVAQPVVQPLAVQPPAANRLQPVAARRTATREPETPLPFDAATVSGYMKANRDLTMRLTFTLGTGKCTFYTCDLTYDYVRLNADYTT